MIGATGFLGRAVCAALRAADVPTAEFTSAAPFRSDTGVPAPGLIDATTVYYLAGAANPATAERSPELLEGERALFEGFLSTLGRLSDRPVVVFPGSGGTVYDTTVPPPYTEAAALGPRGRYGASRLEMERRLLSAADVCKPTVLRISNVYGVGQRSGTGQGVIAHWVAAAAEGAPIMLYGDPASTRDFIYIDDVAAAAVKVSGDSPPVVNIGSGTPTSLAELADLISELTGRLDIRRVPERGFDVPHNWLDITLAREALGWSPTVSLREGLGHVCRASLVR